MTAQASERLIFNGAEMYLCELPLHPYFALTGLEPKFAVQSTACWRGYVGTWEIKDSRLYLIDLAGLYEDNSPITLESLFPAFPDRVFAHWYSGTLRVPQGELLNYVHGGWASTYERDLLIEVEDGMVKSMRMRHNKSEVDGADDQ